MAKYETLDTLITRLLGVPTRTTRSPTVFQIGVAVGQVLKQNPNRVGAVIVNASANTVYVAPFNSVASTRGVRLGPSGGTLALVWFEDFHSVGWEWFAVADGAASDVYVQEVITGPSLTGEDHAPSV